MATAGDIATAGLIATRLAQMSGWVSMTAMGIFSNIGEVEDGMRTLSPPHTIVDAAGAAAPARARGAVDFEDVRFGYGRPSPALEDFTLHVRPGERVALVGRSGAGKTTAVSLLLRLYEVEGGRILLDGTDIRDLTQDALRTQIGTVRQETAMFNRSAYDNILYGAPRRDRGGGPRGGAPGGGPRLHPRACATSGGGRAMPPTSASAGSSSRAGSGSASRWRG